jgi:transcriptional regulator with XRE-family HTH domain
MNQESDNAIERSIGGEIRSCRKKIGLTISELAGQASLSSGMLSKIETGRTSPSLSTLQSLSKVLNVPITAFFRKYEEESEASFVKAGQGLAIDRRGSRTGHQYQLLGHSLGKNITVEPYMILLNEESEVFPLFQHGGMEYIYMLEGEMVYTHANSSYRLEPGDSLLFDANVTHGPEELVRLPIRFLSVMVSLRNGLGAS